MTQTAVEAAIAAAAAAAANLPAQAMGATAGAVSTAVTPPVPGKPLTADDMLTGSLDVDKWLKVNEFGMFIGSDKTPFSTLRVRLDLSEVQYCYSVRWGNPAQYAKSNDRQVDARSGKPWAQVLQQAQAMDPRAAEFRSADIPFKMLEDVVGKDKSVLIEADQTLGVSISMTGWKNFQTFLRQLARAGIDHNNDVVDIELGYEVRKKDTNEWGVLTYNNATLAD